MQSSISLERTIFCFSDKLFLHKLIKAVQQKKR